MALFSGTRSSDVGNSKSEGCSSLGTVHQPSDDSKLKKNINACASTLEYSCTIPTNASPPNDLLTNACLKKKEVQTKSSKRKQNWLDKKHKARKKRESRATSQLVEEMREVGEVAGGGGGAQVANDRVYRDNAEVPEGYKTNLSFTQLLMGPITDDLFTGS